MMKYFPDRLLIFIVFFVGKRGVNCISENFIMVESIMLRPMPYWIEEAYLLDMSVEDRRNLCNQIQSEVEHPILLPEDTFYYVPGTHMYRFDTEDWLAIQCPTIPSLYISYERFKTNVSPGKSQLAEHRFYEANMEERWHLCNKAQQVIRYDLRWKNYVPLEKPQFYEFYYANRWTEIDFAFRCPTDPPMFLGLRDVSHPELVTITLIGGISSDLKDTEQNPRYNVMLNSPSPPSIDDRNNVFE